jgi:4-amino-4-deoxy-L-arabinose transferase-like glycosyltransferase
MRSVNVLDQVPAGARRGPALSPEVVHSDPATVTVLEEWLPAIAMTALFVFMLLVTWNRWSHPIIDQGREMNVPARILSGERLYIDIMYYYGPFAPYFNALLYQVFGVHLKTLYASGILCAALVLVMIHWIGRRLLSPWAAALSTSLVLVTCAIQVNLGNYVQPYSYAALYGWIFAVGALVCALQYLRADADVAMLVGGILAAGAIVSKPEMTLLGLAPAGVAWALQSSSAGLWRWRPLLLLIVPPLAIAGSVYGVILWLVPWKFLVTDTYRAFTQPQMVYFGHLLNGTLYWPQTGWALLAGIGVLACMAGGFALFGLGSDPSVSMFRGSRARAVWVATILGAAAWYAGSRRSGWIDSNPLRSAPLVLASIVLTTAWHAYREKSRGAALSIQERSLLVIAVFSGFAIVRVILNVSFAMSYIPFTIPTLLIVYVWLLVDYFPRFLLATDASRTGARHSAMVVGVILLVVASYVQFLVARKYKVFEISAPRGTLLTTRSLGRPMADAIRFVHDRTAPGEYVGSLPQGSIVNFLAERANPLREEIIVPGYLTPDRETDAIHRMSDRRVRVILVGNVLTPEYRDNAFGVDYNRHLMQWIEANYHPVATFSDEGGAELSFGAPAFFIRAYERNQ